MTRRRAAKRYVTKPGKHGTLFRFVIMYRDSDPACPAFDWRCWAYDTEHALDKFWSASDGDGDGWTVLSTARAEDRS